MNLFITPDKQSYRRWINILPGFLIPGSAQFLSGRRRAGLIWFMAAVALGGVMTALILNPGSGYDFEAIHWFDAVGWVFGIGMMVDACRRPIRRLGFKGWAGFAGALLLLIVAPAFLVRQFWFQPFKLPTAAMQPTLMGITKDEQGSVTMGDHILVSKVVYRGSVPQRGDVVVFRTSGLDHPNVRKNSFYVKRIVGLPGETVSIEPPYVLINGEKAVDPGILKMISEGVDGYGGYGLAKPFGAGSLLNSPEDTLVLGDDEYLVLGDNSEQSLDGRYFGPIKRSSIVGKAMCIYAPADRRGWVK